MSFKNVRISKCVELGAVGGPGFKTTIIETMAGDEYRNIDWSRQRGKWDIGYIDELEKIQDIIAFFQVMRGKAYGFRFRDWSDYKMHNTVGVGDGTNKTFQAAKIYDLGDGHQFSRKLTRLGDGCTVTLVAPGGGITAPPHTINADTGVITFSAAPPADYAVNLRGTFDVPVRFDVDELPVTMLHQGAAHIESVPIIEIRD